MSIHSSMLSAADRPVRGGLSSTAARGRSCRSRWSTELGPEAVAIVAGETNGERNPLRDYLDLSIMTSDPDHSMSTLSVSTPALTILSEEESLFRDAVHEFAETEIRPHV